jgi:hypothetical protein
MPEKRTHDYLRHGTTSLFAALDTADVPVISSVHRKHRAIEFKKFLQKIDTQVPAHLDVHLICDNYGTHKRPGDPGLLAVHPPLSHAPHPDLLQLDQPGRALVRYLTQDLLQRSDHGSVHALERDIRNWVAARNEDPKPFILTKTAEQILESLSRLLQRLDGGGHLAGAARRRESSSSSSISWSAARSSSASAAWAAVSRHRKAEPPLLPRLARSASNSSVSIPRPVHDASLVGEGSSGEVEI